MSNNIYVGWDSREDIAYQVCEHSIRRRTNQNSVNVSPETKRTQRTKAILARARQAQQYRVYYHTIPSTTLKQVHRMGGVL